MWDNFIIGKGDKLCSAVTRYRSKNTSIGISENRSFYWISGCIFDKGITIYKDCKEGKRLTELLALPNDENSTIFSSKKSKDRKITEYLNNLILKRISYDDVMRSIENIREKAFEEGKQAKILEIRNILTI